MKIISHRGLWNNAEEKNTEAAFVKAFSSGFGVETDIRDFNGELVISHDIASSNSLKAEKFFQIYCKYNKELILALNVKSDGIQKLTMNLLNKYDIKNYFLFDMSVPEQYVYSKNHFIVYTRHSDLEKELVLYDKSAGVWMDEFDNEWIHEEAISYHLKNNKKVCIVSPELHGKDYRNKWSMYKTIKNDEVILCTDKPIEAVEFFNE